MDEKIFICGVVLVRNCEDFKKIIFFRSAYKSKLPGEKKRAPHLFYRRMKFKACSNMHSSALEAFGSTVSASSSFFDVHFFDLHF
jgi:hypothetical protein